MKIQLKLFYRGMMQGNQSRFAELCQPNGQKLFIEINIVAVKPNDFTDPHASYGHQAKEGIIGQRAQTC
jgi:hypothetical protein